jgi:hypothetical protein
MHRFRPILLTAAAAILGMIPIAPTVFWGPMAYAIMGGLAVATLLTLVFLPALYVAWFRIGMPHREPEPEQEPLSASHERQATELVNIRDGIVDEHRSADPLAELVQPGSR